MRTTFCQSHTHILIASTAYLTHVATSIRQTAIITVDFHVCVSIALVVCCGALSAGPSGCLQFNLSINSYVKHFKLIKINEITINLYFCITPTQNSGQQYNKSTLLYGHLLINTIWSNETLCLAANSLVRTDLTRTSLFYDCSEQTTTNLLLTFQYIFAL